MTGASAPGDDGLAGDAPGGVQGSPLAAALFDMDGVVTDTADAHAAAWKRLFDEFLRQRSQRTGEEFHPFDIERDYRMYVDGKSRYDGVASFLGARGIELPRGDPADEPRQVTVCGLGNRKNDYFREWLDEHRVEAYPATRALIERLRRAGVAVGIFSASRNARAVLASAGVEGLFDAHVDGVDVDRLGLAGKPDPAILLEAAGRLDCEPARTAVIEDAVAGVRAGARGGFQPVIGVNRGDYREALADAGAAIVVEDVGELALMPDGRIARRRLDALPSARDRRGELADRLAERQPAVFLDYDGTLTPIVEDPAAADLDTATRETLRALAARFPVSVISGRSLADLRARVGLDGLVYAGSHGFEIAGPGFEHTPAAARAFLPALEQAEAELREGLAGIEGHLVERKPFAIAVHYRRVASDRVGDVERAVDRVLGDHPRLRKGRGKKVLQLQPRLAWDKGRAVAWLLQRLGLVRDDVVPVYIGDDLTDEDAFRALAGRGITLALRDGDRATAADYALADPGEVRWFLRALAASDGLAA